MAELRVVIEQTVQDRARTRAGSNLGGPLNDVLGRADALSREGEFEAEDEALAKAQAEMRAAEARLLERHILNARRRRDPEAAARHAEARVMLDEPEDRFEALKAEQHRWHKVGEARRNHFDLPVSSLLASRLIEIAATDEHRGDAHSARGYAIFDLYQLAPSKRSPFGAAQDHAKAARLYESVGVRRPKAFALLNQSNVMRTSAKHMGRQSALELPKQSLIPYGEAWHLFEAMGDFAMLGPLELRQGQTAMAILVAGERIEMRPMATTPMGYDDPFRRTLLDDARTSFEAAWKLSRKTKDTHTELKSLQELIMLYLWEEQRSEGDEGKAEAADEAVKFARKVQALMFPRQKEARETSDCPPRWRVTAFDLLGRAYRKRAPTSRARSNDWDMALSFHERALEMQEKLDSPEEIERVRCNVATAYKEAFDASGDARNATMAEEKANAAMKRFSELGSDREMIHAAMLVALIRMAREERERP